MPSRPHHIVYVIELDDAAWSRRRFREANPQWDPAKECVYVGCTGLTPEERFENHLSGRKDCPIARDFGLKLRPDLYQHLEPMPWKEALEAEVRLAEELRSRGYAVWQR